MSESNPEHKYERGSKILYDAATAMGVDVEPQQFVEWRYLISSAYALDNVIDDTTRLFSDNSTAFDQLLDEVVAGELSTDRYGFDAQQITESWEYQKVQRIVSAASRVKEIALAKRTTDSATFLGSLALIEGSETARFLEIDEANEEDRRFNDWLHDFMQFGVVIDATVDLEQDYSNQLTLVEPTRANQIRIARTAVRPGLRLIRSTPRKIYQDIIGAGLATVNDRAKDSMLTRS